MIIICEGPDGTGKTNIGKALADRLELDYFKASSEHQNWRANAFKTALEFDQTYIADFLEQVRADVVIDRAYPSEYVYSHVYRRETNLSLIREIDRRFSDLGATIIILLRHDYSGVKDELVENNKLDAIHHMYWAFYSETRCNCIVMYVDDFDDDIGRQIPELESALEIVTSSDKPRKLIIAREFDVQDSDILEEDDVENPA